MPNDADAPPTWTECDIERTFAEIAEAERKSRLRPNRVRVGRVGEPYRFLPKEKKQMVDELIKRGRLRLANSADGLWVVTVPPKADYGLISGSITILDGDGRTGTVRRYINLFNAAFRRDKTTLKVTASVVAIIVLTAGMGCWFCVFQGCDGWHHHSTFEHVHQFVGGREIRM